MAAAIMAHLQCSNALIEPGVALHEYASSKDKQEALGERDLFRRADNLDPRVYADIALGRRSRISPTELESVNLPLPTRDTDFSEQPPIWKCSNLLALRLALFELQDGKQAEKFKRFLGWMHLDFMWSAAATQFASLYFSSQRSGGMLKRIRSKDRSRAMRGVENAAWDLTLLQYWSCCANQQQNTKKLHFICSRDVALLRLASDLVADVDKLEMSKRSEMLFREHWGQEGAVLLEFYQNLSNRKNDPERAVNRGANRSDWDKLVPVLEAEFQNHQSIA